MGSKVLVTGGAGFIGSHTLVELLQADKEVLVLDNLCNSTEDSLHKVTQITGKEVEFIKGDIRDSALLDKIFAENSIESVIHFAGLKAVGESVAQPLKYYSNNVYGSQVLFAAMAKAGVFKLVFSSSATVYGEPAETPISENCPLARPTNPYGRSKLMVEDILQDLSVADSRWSIALLRYFNPVGAHSSGLIGENPSGIPNNLMPFIARVAAGDLPKLSVFGGDYPTKDGTGVRDYIHVVDLALGHLAALSYLDARVGVHIWNLGTGVGYSVLDMVKAFESVNSVPVPYEIVERRAGDIAVCYSLPDKAKKELGWEANRDLEQMMLDSWRFVAKSKAAKTAKAE